MVQIHRACVDDILAIFESDIIFHRDHVCAARHTCDGMDLHRIPCESVRDATTQTLHEQRF